MGRRSGETDTTARFDANSVLQDDFFLPAQYAAMRAPSHWSGERKLMLSVLSVALRDLHGKNQRIAWEARVWFESADDYLFSFANISRCLGLSQRDRASILAGTVSLKRHRNRVPVRGI